MPVPDAPVIWSTSSPVSSRAPWRISTRFDMIDSLLNKFPSPHVCTNQRIHGRGFNSRETRIKILCHSFKFVQGSFTISPKWEYRNPSRGPCHAFTKSRWIRLWKRRKRWCSLLSAVLENPRPQKKPRKNSFSKAASGRRSK